MSARYIISGSIAIDFPFSVEGCCGLLLVAIKLQNRLACNKHNMYVPD